MTVKVIACRIVADGKVYEIGDEVDGLSKAEEKRLIKEGYCEPVAKRKETPSDGKPQGSDPNGSH